MRDDGNSTPPPDPAPPPEGEVADDFDDLADADIASALDALETSTPAAHAPVDSIEPAEAAGVFDVVEPRGVFAPEADSDATAQMRAVDDAIEPADAIGHVEDASAIELADAIGPREAASAIGPADAIEPAEGAGAIEPSDAIAPTEPTDAIEPAAAPATPDAERPAARARARRARLGREDRDAIERARSRAAQLIASAHATDTVDLEDPDADDDWQPDTPDSLVGAIEWHDDAHPGPLRVALAGGGGGVGRTLLAANLAIFFARLGRTVGAVDLDPIGAGLHTALGLPPILPAPADALRAPEARDPEPVPGVSLHLLRGPRPTPRGPADPLRAELLTAALDRTDDVLVLDLGAGADPLSLDTWLAADVSLIVAEPLPAAIERVYGFLRAAVWRKLLHGRDHPTERARAALADDPAIDGPLTLIDAVAAHDTAAADALRARLLACTPRIVMNRTKTRVDREMGPAMVSALRRRWGLRAEALGALDLDDAVYDAARRHRALLLAYPGAAYSLALDKIARRVAAIAEGKAAR